MSAIFYNEKSYGDGIIVDNELSTTSTNPPTNAAVTNKLGTTDISSIGNGTVTGAVSAINQNLVKSIEINVGALELKNSENGLYYNVYTPVLPSGSKIINAVWTSGYDGGVILGIAGNDVTFHSPTRHTINTSYANITIYYI